MVVEWNSLHGSVWIVSHSHLLLVLLFLGFCTGMWHNIMLPEEVQKLRWDLHKSLLSEEMWVCLKIIEWHELNDICSHVFTVILGVESLLVTIENLHRFKISITDTNNNNGNWEFRSSNNFVNCFVHIINDTICDDHANLEFLAFLRDWL